MPEFDAYHLAFPLLVLLICIASYETQKVRLKNQIKSVAFQNETIAKELETATAEARKMTETCEKMTKQMKERGPSRELKEFLRDIEVKGYGVARIDPDNIFYRGR